MENKSNKITVRLIYDYGTGPIYDFGYDFENGDKDYFSRETNNLFEDNIVSYLDDLGKDIYYKFYEEDSHDEAMWFNDDLFEESRGLLITIIDLIKERVYKIGSNKYDIEDRATASIFDSIEDEKSYFDSIPEFKDGKKCVYIKLDFLSGPLRYLDLETFNPVTGVELIDNDEILCKLNADAAKITNTLYESNLPTGYGYIRPIESRVKESKLLILDYIDKIKNRLKEINDGTFTIIDQASDKLSKY